MSIASMSASGITIDQAAAWSAVLARNRAADGRFVTGVLSTGIYCRPSCAARHPRRENVRFFANGAEAGAFGLRPCLRCRPDEVAGDERAIARVIALISSGEAPPSLAEMAAVAGYSPHHFHRIFRRATGVTPAAYARSVRAGRVEVALASESNVTAAVYAAGYAAPARFYADVDRRLGMTPGVWRRGGTGVTIRWMLAATPLGPLLLAFTDRGICRIAFHEDDRDVRRLFPRAVIERADSSFSAHAVRVISAVEVPAGAAAVPSEVLAAAFVEAARQELGRLAYDDASGLRVAGPSSDQDGS